MSGTPLDTAHMLHMIPPSAMSGGMMPSGGLSIGPPPGLSSLDATFYQFMNTMDTIPSPMSGMPDDRQPQVIKEGWVYKRGMFDDNVESLDDNIWVNLVILIMSCHI